MPSTDDTAAAAGALYDAVRRLDGATRERLAASLHRSVAEVFPLLETLVDEGLVWVDDSFPPLYRRADPTAGLIALAANRRADLERLSERLEIDLGVLDALLGPSDSVGGWRPGVDRVVDLPSIRTRLAELHSKASVELLAFDFGRPSRASKARRQEAYEASARLDREWLARGGSMRTIFTEAVQYDPLAWAFTTRPVDEGGSVRLSPTLPLQLLIIDRTIAVAQVDPLDSDAGALFISEPGVVSALVDLFEVYWMHSTEVGAPPANDVGSLTPQQRAVLGLLELGHKDESIARHLGVSLRTASRIIADTLEVLGAESRFQAGVLAAKRGWL